MKIVDNRVEAEFKELEAGEIIEGKYSGNKYMVLRNKEKALDLVDLSIHTISNLVFNRTGIKPENVTITFEGVK